MPEPDSIAPPVADAITELNGRIAFSQEELAEKTGLGRTTVRRLVGTGQLKSVKIGRRRLVPATEVVRLLRDGGTTDHSW